LTSQRILPAILGAGALVFAISAGALLLAPATLADLLGLTATADVSWVLRLMGAVLVALAGQMFLVRRGDERTVRTAAIVMIIGGGLMTVITFLAPGDWTLLRVAYAIFGSAFCVAYIVVLAMPRERKF
jgi:peptidoglycan/LPS O-acetylase OafA/YrhL